MILRLRQLLGLFYVIVQFSNTNGGATYNSEKKTYIASGFKDVPGDIPAEAETVILHNNYLRTIPVSAFTGLTNCIYLNLTSNNIFVIKAQSFFSMEKLITLILEQNNLSTVAFGMFQGLSFLKKLSLSHNLIHFMQPNCFIHLEHLEELDLSSNEITKIIINNFRGLELLKLLRLSSNHIATIDPGSFPKLNKLEEIDLSFNNLTEIRVHMFQGLPSLVMLNLTSNKIKEMAADSLPAFGNIILRHNLITSFNKSIVNKTTYPTEGLYLDLRMNLLTCDNRLCWLVNASISCCNVTLKCSPYERPSGIHIEDFCASTGRKDVDDIDTDVPDDKTDTNKSAYYRNIIKYSISIPVGPILIILCFVLIWKCRNKCRSSSQDGNSEETGNNGRFGTFRERLFRIWTTSVPDSPPPYSLFPEITSDSHTINSSSLDTELTLRPDPDMLPPPPYTVNNNQDEQSTTTNTTNLILPPPYAEVTTIRDGEATLPSYSQTERTEMWDDTKC